MKFVILCYFFNFLIMINFILQVHLYQLSPNKLLYFLLLNFFLNFFYGKFNSKVKLLHKFNHYLKILFIEFNFHFQYKNHQQNSQDVIVNTNLLIIKNQFHDYYYYYCCYYYSDYCY